MTAVSATRTAHRMVEDFLARGSEPPDVWADDASLARRYGVSLETVREARWLLASIGDAARVGGTDHTTRARDASARRGSLPAHTARRLMRDFLGRGLAPGEVLADEATLVERYGVSRGTLRQALRLLSFLGAVTVKTGPAGGPRLSTPEPSVVGSALGMVVQFRGATLRTVFEARLAIEPAVASLAAVHRTDVDLALLDESLRALVDTQERSGPEYREQAVRYLVRVAEASRNAFLATIVPALAAMTATVPRHYTRDRSELTGHVRAVIEAIRLADADAAGDAARHRVGSLLADLQAHRPGQLENRILWPDLDEVLSGDRPP